VADAPPVIVFVATRTCFRSIYTVVFAAIAVVVCKAICPAAGPMANVNVCADAEVFVTAIFETTVVVDAGTVYRTVVVVVDAAVLASTLVVVAISYYLR